MYDISKSRELIKIVRELAPHMTASEISDIGLVLANVVDRLEKDAITK